MIFFSFLGFAMVVILMIVPFFDSSIMEDPGWGFSALLFALLSIPFIEYLKEIFK